jgi:ABC-type glycerol-3-phosphate transport system substrate-binding protein
MFVVSEDSPYPDEAWRFVQFIMSDEGYTAYTGIGGVIPTTRSVANLPRFSEDPMMQIFLNQPMAPIQPFYRISRALEMIGAYIERFCYGRITADDLLVRAERDIDALLAPNKREILTSAAAEYQPYPGKIRPQKDKAPE